MSRAAGRADADDDPVALRSAPLFRVFAAYLRYRLGRDFNAVRLARDGAPPPLAFGRPVVVYGNHPSWWDPAMFILLSDMLFRGRPGFGPMEAAAFARYGIFRRLGIFGIAPEHPRGARRFLEMSRRVLAVPGGMMWITAEGRFRDVRARPLALRPGIAHLARLRPGTAFLPLALEYGFWEESRPEAFVRFGAPVAIAPGLSIADASRQLEAGLAATMERLAGDVAARDPAAFRTLVQGRAGTSAVYDGWRRVRAGLRGERFRASHGTGT